jgi:hypothetical protein
MSSDLVNVQHFENIICLIRNIFRWRSIKLLMIMFLLPLTDRILIYTIYENDYANIFYVVLL